MSVSVKIWKNMQKAVIVIGISLPGIHHWLFLRFFLMVRSCRRPFKWIVMHNAMKFMKRRALRLLRHTSSPTCKCICFIHVLSIVCCYIIQHFISNNQTYSDVSYISAVCEKLSVPNYVQFEGHWPKLKRKDNREPTMLLRSFSISTSAMIAFCFFMWFWTFLSNTWVSGQCHYLLTSWI